MSNPSKKGKTACRKGKEFETAVANALCALKPGAKGKRNLQSQGNNTGNPDIKVTGLDAFHVECKAVETFNLKKAMQQATSECASRIPLVVHKYNRTPWTATLLFEDATSAAVAWLEWLGWRVKPPKEEKRA